MLGKPDELTYAALHRLSVDADGQRVFDWLRSEVGSMEKVNRIEKDGVLLRQRQGALQAVTDLLGKAAEAKTVMQKLRSA